LEVAPTGTEKRRPLPAYDYRMTTSRLVIARFAVS
jgi:hypothetical protein